MRTPAPPLDSAPFRRLSAELAAWRRTARPGFAIPARLWADAVALARKEGPYRVARALGLCGSTLKDRLEAAGRVGGPAHPGFVELPAPLAMPATAPIVLELSDPGAGRRLRIELRASGPADVATLVRELWQVAR